MKKILLLFSIILFDLILLLGIGHTFSVLFIILTVWFIYGWYVVKYVAHKNGSKHFKRVLKLYTTAIMLFICSFIIIESLLVINIHQFKDVAELDKLDYVIVLGAGLRGEEVSNTLKLRLDKALAYYNYHQGATLIVSGGQGKDEVISEAEAMKRYLEKNGVPSHHIFKEDQSTTTLQNIQFSKAILEKRNASQEKVLIVTNEYHLPRARMLAKSMGIKNEGLASTTPLSIRLNYLIREYVTWIIDFIRVVVL